MFHEHFTGEVPVSGHTAIKEEHQAIEDTINVCTKCMQREVGSSPTCVLDALASMIQHDIQEIVLILFLVEPVSQEDKETSGWKRLWGSAVDIIDQKIEETVRNEEADLVLHKLVKNMLRRSFRSECKSHMVDMRQSDNTQDDLEWIQSRLFSFSMLGKQIQALITTYTILLPSMIQGIVTRIEKSLDIILVRIQSTFTNFMLELSKTYTIDEIFHQLCMEVFVSYAEESTASDFGNLFHLQQMKKLQEAYPFLSIDPGLESEVPSQPLMIHFHPCQDVS